MKKIRISPRPGFVIDMDGVIYRGSKLISGAAEFVRRLRSGGHPFIFLTNNSERTQAQLREKMSGLGIDVETDHFFTSAMATARFLSAQNPGGKAFIIAGEGLRVALRKAGYIISEKNPDYVIVGNSESYGYDDIKKAVNLVLGGARLIGTNPDVTGPVEDGLSPGCGALIKPIELATGRKPYFIGKPNPLMMRMALHQMGLHSANSYMVGDRMDTDIEAGLEAGMKTILVLSGVTARGDISRFAYKPRFIYNHVGLIPVHNLE